MPISIDQIESVLADAGVVTEFYGDDDRTTFTMENGGQTVELYDAVSGDSFDADKLTAAISVPSIGYTDDVTSAFESVETLDEFITAVNNTFGTVV